jgi:hypothetical protein
MDGRSGSARSAVRVRPIPKVPAVRSLAVGVPRTYRRFPRPLPSSTAGPSVSEAQPNEAGAGEVARRATTRPGRRKGRSLSRGDRRRMSSPISAYVGSNGGGKTLCAVRDVLLAVERDPQRMILSTCIIDHPNFVQLRSWSQLLMAQHAEVLLDEVTGVASARSFADMPPQLLQLFVQLRKRDLRVRWTTPNYARADVVLREVTRSVTYCTGYLGRIGTGGWPEHRLFRWTTYDAQEFDEFQAGKRENCKKLGLKLHWRGDSCEFAGKYDTLGSVGTLDHVNLAGACLNCGGQRARRKCSCDDLQAHEIAMREASAHAH